MAVAGVLAVAVCGTIAAVPESPWGFAAIVSAPSAAGAAAALGLLGLIFATGHWGIAAPLAAVVAPLVAPRLGAAWMFAGAGGLLAWAVTAGAGLRAAVAIAPVVAHPRRHALAAAAAAVLWLGTVATAVAPFALTGDAPHYLTIARSLVADGDLDLRNDYDARTYAAFYPGSLEPRHTNPGPGGEDYPFHGVGVSVLVAPAFAVAGKGGAVATLVLVMAGASALVWLTAWHLLRDAAVRPGSAGRHSSSPPRSGCTPRRSTPMGRRRPASLLHSGSPPCCIAVRRCRWPHSPLAGSPSRRCRGCTSGWPCPPACWGPRFSRPSGAVNRIDGCALPGS